MMDIRDDWTEVARRMRAARALGVLLSLDDALFGSADQVSPREVAQNGCEKLLSLSRLDRVAVAVHSGEKLSDLLEEVRVPGIWYVANHGFELRDPQGKEIQFFGPEDIRLIDHIHEELLLQTAHVVGVRLIHRGPCLALNYEEVDSSQIPVILDIFRNVTGPLLPQLAVIHDRSIIEARIRTAFDEKTALRYVHRRLIPGTLFFYFGGDPVLLEMFGDYRPFNILVEVGVGKKTSAKYGLPGAAEVVDVLGRIETHWKGGVGSTIP